MSELQSAEKTPSFHQKIATRLIYTMFLLCMQTGITFVCFEWLSRNGEYKQILTFVRYSTRYTIYTLATVFALYLILYLLTNDLRSGLGLHILLIILGVAETLKYTERKEFVEVSDFTIIDEWTGAVGDVKVTIWKEIIISSILMVLLYVAIFLTKKYWKKKRESKILIVCHVACVCLVVCGMCGGYYYVAQKNLMETILQDLTYYEKGGIASFAESIAYLSLMSGGDTSELYAEALAYYGYDEDGNIISDDADTTITLATQENVDEIEVKPNIIVIMSEALWDINQCSDIATYSENPLADFEEVALYSGTTGANIFGGGTDKSEYEFLTGWSSKYLLNVKSAYQTYFYVRQASIVQYLTDLGYRNYAIHPYKGTYWHRATAYESMGFENFYDMYTMEYAEVEYVFVTDESLTNEIIYRYEELRQETDDPIFSFNVSVQNHVKLLHNGDEGQTYNTDISVDFLVDVSSVSEKQVAKYERYVNGIAQSAAAFKALVEYFEDVDEPTIILLYGDHAPSFIADFEEFLDDEIVNEKFYETPFYVWSNYDTGVEFGTDYTNISSLSTYLLEYANLPLTKQTVLNKYMSEFYSINTRYEIKDTDGNEVDTSSAIYVSRFNALFNAMQNAMNSQSYDTDIWTIFDTTD